MGSSGSHAGPASAADLTGAVVGRFRVLRKLGAGGMGEVYAAQDATLKRTVALKRVIPSFTAQAGGVANMLQEAERASALNHPAVASIYDVFEHGGDVFLVMEYVEGVSLRQRLEQHPPRAEMVHAIAQCADALAAAHAKGIVHGDVKPENIMLGAGGRVKLLDFGVARRMESGTTEAGQTRTGFLGLAGTVEYMAPEALLQHAVDPRSDLFSLGVVLYEALTGVHPFRGATAISTSDRTLHEEPRDLTLLDREMPVALARITTRLLAKQPEGRYQAAADVAADLRAVGDEPKSARLRPSRRSFAWIFFLLAAVAAALPMNAPSPSPTTVIRRAPPS